MYKIQVSIIGFVVLQLSTFNHGLLAGLATSHLGPSSFSSQTVASPQDPSIVGKLNARSTKKQRAIARELPGRKRRCIDDVKSPPADVQPPTADITVAGENKAVSIDLIPKSGDATYYATGLGACGKVHNDNSMIAAASHLLFDTFPGATANPNLNPICGRKVLATYNGKSVEVEIVDRCTGCAIHDLDFSPAAFQHMGTLDEGRLHGMTWKWL